MASLDDESLFTKAPSKETTKNFVNSIFSNIFCGDKLTRKDSYDLLKLETTKSFFVFDNKFCKQIGKVAMGLHMDPTLANAFLHHYEKI